jgi:hypothetical protein
LIQFRPLLLIIFPTEHHLLPLLQYLGGVAFFEGIPEGFESVTRWDLEDGGHGPVEGSGRASGGDRPTSTECWRGEVDERCEEAPDLEGLSAERPTQREKMKTRQGESCAEKRVVMRFDGLQVADCEYLYLNGH